VKLTREQAELIEYALSDDEGCYDGDKDRLLYGVLAPNIRYHNELSDLNNIEDVVLLAKALYIGYEVEETFEVGDWIYSKQVEKFIKIEDEGQLEGYNKFPSYYRSATPEEIAKEKERRWWAKHGREVWGLRRNDLVSD